MTRQVIRRVDVLGVQVSEINPRMALDEIERWIADGERHYVCVTGVHGVMESQRDPVLLAIHNQSGLTTPDGMPMVWAGRWAGSRIIERVYGPELMLRVMARSKSLSWRHYLYGSTPEVLTQLRINLEREFPGIEIVGSESPPFRELTELEMHTVNERINQASPDIVWVGLSTPKQERWMGTARQFLTAPVLIGVGAAFDIHAGTLRQAPKFVRQSGLEWAYRLIHEPRRLWGRYLRNNPSFVYRILRRPPKIIH